MIEYYRKYKRFFFPLLALFISLYLVQTASHFGEKHIPVTGEGKWNRGSRLCRWDTGFYISIIEQGYRYIPGEQRNLAFFPLYPLMAKLLMSFGFSIPIALLSISWVSIILSVYLLYGIFLDRFGEKAAQYGIFLIVLYPYAIFWWAAYTESLKLLFYIAVICFLHKRKYYIAAILSGLNTALHPTGVAVSVTVFFSYIHDIKPRSLQELAHLGILSIISFFGLIAFVTFTYLQFNDPLAFIHVHKAWEASNSAFIIKILNLLFFVPVFQSFIHGHFNLFNPHHLDKFFFLIFAVFIIIDAAKWKRMSFPEYILCISTLLIPYYFTGYENNMRSMGRYVMCTYPVFGIAGNWLFYRRCGTKIVIFSVFILLMVLWSILFTSWKWVG